MKKYLLLFFSVIFMFCFNTSISLASNEYATITGGGDINVGDSVNVAMKFTNNNGMNGMQGTLTYNPEVVEFVTAEGCSASADNGTVTYSTNYDGVTKSADAVFTFKGVGGGSTDISMDTCEIINSVGPVNCAGGIVSITVAGDAAKSNDANLSELSIAQGNISPEFNPDVTDYSLTVGSDQDKLDITANPSSDKASVGIKGADALNDGENKVVVSVTAEDGSVKEYNISVTKEASGDSSENKNKDNGDKDTKENKDDTKKKADIDLKSIMVGQTEYELNDNIPKKIIPADFKASVVDISGETVNSLAFEKGDITLVYLKNKQTTKSSLFVYVEKEKAFYPFVKIKYKDTYLIFTEVFDLSIVPDNYIATTVKIDKKTINVYQYGQTVETSQDEDKSTSASAMAGIYLVANAQGKEEVSDFYLLYAMNSNGESAWYQYDVKDQTIQRYNGDIYTTSENAKTMEEKYQELENKYNGDTGMLRMIAIILGIVTAGLLASVFVITRRAKRQNDMMPLPFDSNNNNKDLEFLRDAAKRTANDGIEKKPAKEEKPDSKNVKPQKVNSETKDDIIGNHIDEVDKIPELSRTSRQKRTNNGSKNATANNKNNKSKKQSSKNVNNTVSEEEKKKAEFAAKKEREAIIAKENARKEAMKAAKAIEEGAKAAKKASKAVEKQVAVEPDIREISLEGNTNESTKNNALYDAVALSNQNKEKSEAVIKKTTVDINDDDIEFIDLD
ncbi:cadherin-like beta sandwich domain-containing protein [Acetitomaculum ruminis]|nr:cadherin-like beta sandwich domain-containing protein [Acetitomaculum ruminis]